MIRIYGMNLCQYYDFVSLLNTDRDIDLYIDTREYHNNSNLKIYFQSEPDAVYSCYDYLKDNQYKYDYILCYNDEIIDKNKLIINWTGGTWIKEFPDIHLKKFKISMLTGWKNWTYGHQKRHILYNNQLQFNNYPITFFRSGAGTLLPEINNNPILKTSLQSKIDLFKEYQYSITIENCREKNVFTEKIIDCLITKTIPIYYGCPNINEYFDITGWIILETDDIINELKEKLPCLNLEYYYKFTDIIESNYKKAIYYGDCTQRWVDKLTQIPGITKK